MWEVPRYRVRAYIRKKQKAKTQVSSDLKSGPRLHLRRVRAQIKIVEGLAILEKAFQARVLLNDFGQTGLRLFSSERLRPGQDIVIALDRPKEFYVRARVLWCFDAPRSGRVLSESNFNYRVGVEYLFSSSNEEASVKEYCQYLMTEYIFGRRAL